MPLCSQCMLPLLKVQIPNWSYTIHLSIYFWTSILKSPKRWRISASPSSSTHNPATLTSGSAWATSAAVLFSCSLVPSKLTVSDGLGSLFLSCVFYIVCVFAHPCWLKGFAPFATLLCTSYLSRSQQSVLQFLLCSSFQKTCKAVHCQATLNPKLDWHHLLICSQKDREIATQPPSKNLSPSHLHLS